MRVTDPNATMKVSHPSDSAEFEVSVAMPREERMRLTNELQSLFPKDGTPDVAKLQEFYEKICRKYLRALTGVFDASGNPLTCADMGKTVQALAEIRLPDVDNVALWLGNEIFNLNVLNEDAKKNLKFASSTKNGEQPTT